MLTDAFQALLDNATPGRRVTGIVFWEVHKSEAGADALVQSADMKAPIIEAARACPGARVNPLEGTHQAILDVPIEGWRRMLRSRSNLFASPNLRVEANAPAFGTPPDP